MGDRVFLGVFPESSATAVASRFPQVLLGSRDSFGRRRVYSTAAFRLSALAELAPRIVESQSPVRFVTTQQLAVDTLKLLPRIPADVDAIAGVSRSGLASASILAMTMHLPLLVVRQSEKDVVPAGHGFRLQGTDRPAHVLVVDDTSMTGRSLQDTIPIVRGTASQVTTATVYCAPDSKRMPDLWAETLPYPHFLEWNLFNSVFLPGMACDFDGVLCEDCPAAVDDDGPQYVSWMRTAPLRYAPRRGRIPLVVTARLRKYAGETRQWLREKRIDVDVLQMRGEPTLQERRAMYTPEWKAEVFAAWAANQINTGLPAIFVESCVEQSHRIAAALGRDHTQSFAGFTGVYVVCPSAARVWQVV